MLYNLFSNETSNTCSIFNVCCMHKDLSYNTIKCKECVYSLRKHAYSNILKILQPKTGKFPDKNYDIFHISAQNIDCGYSLEPPRRGGSNEYSQSVF